VYIKYPHQNSLEVDLQTMTATLWECEQNRDFETAVSAFKDIWDDLDVDPDFSEFSLIQQAELFRLSGHFLGNYGIDNNQTNYQERAKNLLTRSIEIYGTLNDYKKVADAQNALAMCYIREGAFPEAEVVLEQTVSDFLNDKLDLIYLQNRGNLLIAKLRLKKYEEAVKIIEEIDVPMEFCEDKKACYVYHEKAGIIFNRIKQSNRSVYHYQTALEYAKALDNLAYLSSTKNNLANLYRRIGELCIAHSNVDEAIEIAKNDNQVGWLPIYLDTKATIYFDEGNLKAALETINESISIFEKGDNVGGLTEALWNKCRFLLYLNRKKEAIKLFAELAPLASERMGEFAVDNFAEEFAELIHVKRDGNLEEETKHFRRVEIVTAIRRAKYEMKTAADSLKITLADLNKIIDNEFPELYEEINLERFTALDEVGEIVQPLQKNISELFLTDLVSNLSGEFATFYIAAEKMSEVFGITEDAVTAIRPTNSINIDEYVLVRNETTGVFSFGKTQYNSFANLYFLIDKDEPMPLPLDEVSLIGKAIGYFPFAEIDNEQLQFRPLDF
jgi:tetratricopeptide (TPR) repeat protein